MKPPKWYLPISILALIWNLLGCAAVLSDAMMTPEDVARLTPQMRALHEARPAWALAGTAAAVLGGAAGCLGLILRRRWAMPLLIVSLAGLVVQNFGLFVLADGLSLAGPAALAVNGVVFLIAVGLVLLARTARSRGWIP